MKVDLAILGALLSGADKDQPFVVPAIDMINELKVAREVVLIATIVSSKLASQITGPEWDRLADAVREYKETVA